ncbi:MAG: response regulator [Halochromatium sp.]
MATTDPAAEQRPQLLIVDDVPENIEVLAAALGDDYEIFFAISGEEALEIALNRRIDLILLDIMMPEVDGYEVCRLLKLEPRLAEIPVIFVTAKTELEDEAKGFAVGAVDYIAKPIKRLRVRARVATHLQLKASRDRLRALANVDTVAGLPNRAVCDILLARETLRAEREGTRLSFLLVGLDDVDAIADTAAQPARQRLLERVAQALGALVSDRNSGPLDLCAHAGGSRFAMLLPQADAETACERATAIIAAVAALGIRLPDSQRPLTASVGGITADFARLDQATPLRGQDLALAATQALEQAMQTGPGQLWLQHWEGTR